MKKTLSGMGKVSFRFLSVLLSLFLLAPLLYPAPSSADTVDDILAKYDIKTVFSKYEQASWSPHHRITMSDGETYEFTDEEWERLGQMITEAHATEEPRRENFDFNAEKFMELFAPALLEISENEYSANIYGKLDGTYLFRPTENTEITLVLDNNYDKESKILKITVRGRANSEEVYLETVYVFYSALRASNNNMTGIEFNDNFNALMLGDISEYKSVNFACTIEYDKALKIYTLTIRP